MCRGLHTTANTHRKKRFNGNSNASKQISINLHRINSHNLIFVCLNSISVVIVIFSYDSNCFCVFSLETVVLLLSDVLFVYRFCAIFVIQINKSNETMKRYQNTLHFQLNKHIFISFFWMDLKFRFWIQLWLYFINLICMPEVKQEVFVVDVMKVTRFSFNKKEYKNCFSLFSLLVTGFILCWLFDIFGTRAIWFSPSCR